MGLFGPSKAELEDRIADLETSLDEKDATISNLSRRVRDAESAAQRADSRALDAEQQAREAQEDAEEYARTALELAQTLGQHDEDGAEELPEKEGVVETLDTPAIVWKATSDQIAKLLLPEGAEVVYPKHSNKHRADQAIVLEFYDVETETIRKAFSTRTEKDLSDDIALETTDVSRYNANFEYEVGERVTPDNGDLNTDPTVSCEVGIHFFRTEEEALDWYRA